VVDRLEVRDAASAAAHVGVEVTGPRWLQLAIPLVAQPRTGEVAVAGPPALLPPPPRPGLAATPLGDGDAVAAESMRADVEGFFDAYARGDRGQLRRFTDGEVGDLGGAFAFDGLDVLVVAPPAADGRRAVHARVGLVDPLTGSAFTAAFVLWASTDGQRWFFDGLRPDLPAPRDPQDPHEGI